MLLDTQALLWYVLGSRERISHPLQRRIELGPSVVSIASLWEVAIKQTLGKLEAPDDLPTRLPDLGFELLAIEVEHLWAVRDPPPTSP